MANPAKGELRFEHDGREFRLIFNMTAIDWFEETTDKSFAGAFDALDKATKAGEPPKIGLLVSVLQAGLVTHHPDLSRDEVLALAVNPEVQAKMGVAASMALPAPAGAEGNAPKPKKVSRKGSTSKAGSGSRSKAG